MHDRSTATFPVLLLRTDNPDLPRSVLRASASAVFVTIAYAAAHAVCLLFKGRTAPVTPAVPPPVSKPLADQLLRY